MEDEADIYEGVRAQFPLTFGKQSKSQTPLEAIHNATRRSDPNLTSKPSSSSKTTTTSGLPSLSSSSKEWLNSLRSSKNPTPRFTADRGGGSEIGPPPPPPQAEDSERDDDGVMAGPPPPPPGVGSGADEDEDGEMIGPPPPPPGSNLSSDEDDGSDEDELGNRFRIPLCNEIVLKGHTKVPIPSFFSRLILEINVAKCE